MGRTYLVDAHNALFRLVEKPPSSAEGVRRLVVVRAKDALRRRGEAGAKAHLVFDTAEAGRSLAGTHGRDGEVTWSYAAGSADEEILRLVREHAGGRGGAVAVVTDDRELRGRAGQLGATPLRLREWFDAHDRAVERRSSATGPPMTAADFGLPSESIDLDGTDPDDL